MLGEIMGVIGAASALQSGSNQSYNEEQAQLRQAQINKEQAKYSQGLAMEYWNYTNWENQVDHLKKAGLNPALMYAKGGAGGQTGGGQAQGVGLSPSNQEAVGMGLQLSQIKAQTNLMNAESAKAYAEANRIKGIDTEAGKQGIKESEARIDEIIAKIPSEKQQYYVNKAYEESLKAAKKLSENLAAKTDFFAIHYYA